MTWQLFRLTYALHSPLHVGYHKIGNVQRTRYYIPARNLWAAMTERLTRSGFSASAAPQGDYQKIGEWVQKHCVFSYFFVQEGEVLLYPRYDDDGLCYGNLQEYTFEQRYLSVHVTTALDAATTSAERGGLHEVEFIAPHDRDGAPTKLGGWVFLDAEGVDALGDGARLGDLQVGGERRYGFGQMRLVKFRSGNLIENYGVELDGARPHIKVEKDAPLLAHTLTQRVDARGQIEPLVGRETRGDSRTFGQKLTDAKVCWTPGSVLAQAGAWLTVSDSGVWEIAG